MEFTEFKSESPVWTYFLRCKEREKARCNTCQDILACKGGSTSGLRSHLKIKHKINLPTVGPSTSSSQAVVKVSHQQDIRSLLSSSTSTEQVVAELTACDRLTFNQLATSKRIREALQSQGHKIPKKPGDIRDLVLSHHALKKEEVKEELSKRREKGERFSLTLDEYTSLSDKRYASINLHAQDSSYFSLGMVPIRGSLPAEKAVELVSERLESFGISLSSDIVAATTDGAKVMVKFGRLIPSLHQLCFSHGYHLAVCDFLYKPQVPQHPDTSEDEEETSDDEAEEAEQGKEICGTIKK